MNPTKKGGDLSRKLSGIFIEGFDPFQNLLVKARVGEDAFILRNHPFGFHHPIIPDFTRYEGNLSFLL
jgi:hypothetical protein